VGIIKIFSPDQQNTADLNHVSPPPS